MNQVVTPSQRLREWFPQLPMYIGRYRIKRKISKAVTSLHQRMPTRASRRVVVFTYHSIHPTRHFSSASAELFEEHLAWLSENCECIPFSQVLDRAKDGTNITRPIVSVTFDDGYRDNHETALPLLLKWKIPATFFVTVGLIAEDPDVVGRFRFLLRASHEEIRGLSWTQLVEMQQGGMEVGGHTYSHPNLARQDAQTVALEFRRSKDLLEDHLGTEVRTMSYPFGKPKRHFTREVGEIARQVGYRYAGAIIHRKVRPSDWEFALPRFDTFWDPVEMLKAKVEGAFDLVGIGQEKTPLWVARMISPEDFRAP